MRKQGYGSSKFTGVEVAEARQKSELPHSFATLLWIYDRPDEKNNQ